MRSTDSVSDAIEALQTMNVRHLPIVDERGHLIGMLSDRDLGSLMQRFTEGAEVEQIIAALSRRVVGDFMSGAAVSVDVDAAVTEVIELMLDERIGAVPVVDGADNVIGIISYVDVLRVLGALADEAPSSD
jgi:acetoin utilization protein AcuB